MSRSWRERSCVYIVKAAEGFVPNSPWNWPPDFTEGRLHVKNVTLTDARGTVRTFNKRAIERRAADVAAWDRQWAIACCCVRAKGWDRERTAILRPKPFTAEEIERLLTACPKMRLPEVVSMTPGVWWRNFISTIVSGGLRANDALAIRRKDGAMLFPWPHDKQLLYHAFRELVVAAGIDPAGRYMLHGLRYIYLERVIAGKGGVA